MWRPTSLSIPVTACVVGLGLLTGLGVMPASAEAAPSRTVKSTLPGGCSPGDTQIFRSTCPQQTRPISALGPSVSCVDAPRGFNPFGPPRPFGPVVRYCW
jgi:hypothetical protein